MLYKQLKESDHQKNECENKLIRLQNSFNEQLEEDKKEILRLYKRKKELKSNRENKENNSFYSMGGSAKNIFNSTDFKNNENNKWALLYNENKSLKYVQKDLKKKIKKIKELNNKNEK